jgi:Pyruvate/2-oxoacid:ferredoxin oxidoreductase gamma subunit
MVVLGAASPFLQLSEQDLIRGIGTFFRNKGQEVIDSNIQAFIAGFTKIIHLYEN